MLARLAGVLCGPPAARAGIVRYLISLKISLSRHGSGQQVLRAMSFVDQHRRFEGTIARRRFETTWIKIEPASDPWNYSSANDDNLDACANYVVDVEPITD